MGVIDLVLMIAVNVAHQGREYIMVGISKTRL